MSAKVFRYRFNPDVPMEDVEASMVLALLGAESLHGETRVQLSAAHYLDCESRTCVVETRDEVGGDVNRLFAGLLRREFGPGSFQIEHITPDDHPVSAPAA